MGPSRERGIHSLYVEANGVSTYVERRGRGQPVVLIHALGMNVRSWDIVAEHLAEHFEVIAYDYRGHGRTEKVTGPCTIAVLAEDLRKLLGRLGLRPVHLVGLAVGSMVAQQLALLDPQLIHGLVLASPRSELDQRGVAYNEQRADLVEARGMREVVDVTIERAFPGHYLRSQSETMAWFRGEFLANDPQGYAAVCRGLSTFGLTDRLPEIRCPTLLLAGELDQLCPVSEAVLMQSRIAGSRCETLAGIGHFCAIEAPTEFARRVLAFLRAVSGHPQEGDHGAMR
jgi:3-oxoadipate enol-lactonase